MSGPPLAPPAASRTDRMRAAQRSEHQAEVEKFINVMMGVDRQRWVTSIEEGKWSPAQIAEHIVLYYERYCEELAGESRIRIRTAGWRQAYLRWIMLPGVLVLRALPRALSPKEFLPVTGLSRETASDRLRFLASRYEELTLEAEGNPDRLISHPDFGPQRPLRVLRLSTLHLRHHRHQIETATA